MRPARDVCAIVLAAGEGTRLRPLTLTTPKPLLPVGGIALLDRALDLVSGLDTAVNAHYLAETVVAHVGDRARVEVEPELLGSSGAVANLRDWVDGRDVLIVNSDAYLHGGDARSILEGWGGQTVRLLAVAAGRRPAEFGDRVFAGASLLPWSEVEKLPQGHSHLVHTVWRPAEARGRLELCEFAGTYLDCGTPADYAAANRLASMSEPTSPRSPQ